MFDLSKFLNNVEEAKKIKSEYSRVVNETSSLVRIKTEEIRSLIEDIMYKHFPRKGTSNYKYGFPNWQKMSNEVKSIIDIGPEFAFLLKEKFNVKINRNYKHYVELNINYNINEDNFSTNFYHIGFHSERLLSNEKDRVSAIELLNTCDKIFKMEKTNFSEIELKISKIRETMNSYDAFIVANQLISY